jgi:hypothetical protein
MKPKSAGLLKTFKNPFVLMVVGQQIGAAGPKSVAVALPLPKF